MKPAEELQQVNARIAEIKLLKTWPKRIQHEAFRLCQKRDSLAMQVSMDGLRQRRIDHEKT